MVRWADVPVRYTPSVTWHQLAEVRAAQRAAPRGAVDRQQGSQQATVASGAPECAAGTPRARNRRQEKRRSEHKGACPIIKATGQGQELDRTRRQHGESSEGQIRDPHLAALRFDVLGDQHTSRCYSGLPGVAP